MFKDNLLKNKTIVVTGGGSGLGKSMARRFGELGANLVISGRRKEVLEEAAHEFSEKNIDVLTCPGDVRKIEDVETMSKQTLDKFGTVDASTVPNLSNVCLDIVSTSSIFRTSPGQVNTSIFFSENS